MSTPSLLSGLLLLTLLTVSPGLPPASWDPARSPDYPFAIGEQLTYTARLGFVPIGAGTLSVATLARVRGSETFVIRMAASGGPPGYRMRYEMTSWVGTRQFTSRRFYRHLIRNGTASTQQYEIIPDSSRYRETGVPGDYVTPSEPLDELAMLYFLRLAPLEVGRSYRWTRYFKTGYNPLTVRVLERRPIPLPDGGQAPGLRVEVEVLGSTSEVWLTDDARRLPVRLVLPLPYGNVTFELSRMPAGQP